jgi:hypothetical protein
MAAADNARTVMPVLTCCSVNRVERRPRSGTAARAVTRKYRGTPMIFIALALMAFAWPVIAIGAGVLVGLAGFALSDGQTTQDRLKAWTRAGRRLTAGSALATMAAYGYGLTQTTLGASFDDECFVVRPEAYGPQDRGPVDGTLTMWPLHDTSCGPDLVPNFVNPLVTGSAGLFVTLAVITTVLIIRSRKDLPTP